MGKPSGKRFPEFDEKWKRAYPRRKRIYRMEVRVFGKWVKVS